MFKFFWKQIIFHFGIPHTLISDNGTQFSNNTLWEWCEELIINQIFNYVPHPDANGQTEV